MKLWRWVFLCVAAGSLCLAAVSIQASAQQKSVSEKLIRLHVIADSDSDEDQRVKLLVRDEILKTLRGCSWTSKEEAVQWLQENIGLLQHACEQTLREQRNNDPVRISLGRERYPTRNYDTFSLPAGDYLSLKIIVGDGEGKNWWCVLYPSFCLCAAAQMQTQAASACFTENDVAFITEQSGGIQLKFKVLEWIENFKKK